MSKDITRPPKAQIDALRKIGAATTAGVLSGLGIRNAHMQGPVSWHDLACEIADIAHVGRDRIRPDDHAPAAGSDAIIKIFRGCVDFF